jgi:prephenate dehydrogenase
MADSPSRAAIIGVGLLGGSIGAALRQRWPELPVVGVARRAAPREKALAGGVVTAATASLAEACEGADWVFVCTPVSGIAPAVIEAASLVGEEAVITDVGSTKASLVEAIEAVPEARRKFVGSHPIAGSEKTGPEHASAGLLRDKVVIVTPTPQTDPQRCAQVRRLWERLGAQVTTLTPSQHDQIFAATSHVPHLVSAAIASIITAASLPYVGSGWRDITRVAAGDPTMWTAICLANGKAILEATDEFSRQLATLRGQIAAGDAAGIEAFFQAAKTLRDQAD